MDAETHLAKTAELKQLIRQDMTELRDRAIDIKGKQYVLVADRVRYFNEHYPEGCINTELVSQPDADLVVVKATVYTDRYRNFTGYSQARWGDGYINKTSALENAETSAVGRALAFMGIGVLDSIASADEMHKANGRGKADLSAEDYESNFLDPQHPLPEHRIKALEEACLKNGHSKMAKAKFLGEAGVNDWAGLKNDQFSAAIRWASSPVSVPQDLAPALEQSLDMANAPNAAAKVRVAISQIEAQKCPNCGSKLSPSKQAGGPPYCIPCWKKKKGI